MVLTILTNTKTAMGVRMNPKTVIPAQAGWQEARNSDQHLRRGVWTNGREMGPRFRGGDDAFWVGSMRA